MKQTKLHIVSFDIPYPADYGGAIDVFYKVKSLSEEGCEIYLHCYEYGDRKPQPILEKYCKKVWYYKRDTGLAGLSFTLPYIVSSRKSKLLLANLQQVDAPILFEGVHTTYFLSHPSLSNRFKMVRTQNVEQEYYKGLSKKAISLLSKVYFNFEAILLSRYENSMHAAQAFLTVSLYDQRFFTDKYPNVNSYFIPSFHAYDNVTAKVGNGDYCLYQANLGHPENIEVLNFLLSEVVPFSHINFIISGRNASQDIIDRCAKLPNCSLVENPQDDVMQQLIQEAHIHVLPTFQESGIKLKLLSALFGGRHIVVNQSMLYGTDLHDACHVAEGGKEFSATINRLATVPFQQEDLLLRKTYLAKYAKAVNARKLLAVILQK